MRLTIDRLGHQGDGIGQGSDGPVHAALTLPGEEIEGESTGDRIAAPRILTPSPDRVRAPCPHFGACGGCALQHWRGGRLTEWKVAQVRAQLERAGLATPLRHVHVSPPGSRRRATLAARRTKKGVLVGFHARASDQIIAVPNCKLLHPALMDALPGLGEIAIAGGSRKGEMALALTLTETGLDLAVTGGKPVDAPLGAALAQIARKLDLAQLSWAGDTLARRRPALVTMGKAAVPLPPGAFLQPTLEGEAALVGAVAEAVGRARHVVDLFAGCGTFTLPLAEGAEVTAYEGEAAMTAALFSGWRGTAGALRKVTAETRDLFRRPLVAGELGGFDAVVIDPPRAGAAAQVAALAASDVPVIAHVSCNPATFARDAAVLVAGGYRIDWVDVVDQFLWSPHVELVVAFRRP